MIQCLSWVCQSPLGMRVTGVYIVEDERGGGWIGEILLRLVVEHSRDQQHPSVKALLSRYNPHECRVAQEEIYPPKSFGVFHPALVFW